MDDYQIVYSLAEERWPGVDRNRTRLVLTSSPFIHRGPPPSLEGVPYGEVELEAEQVSGYWMAYSEERDTLVLFDRGEEE